jgi:ribose transport system substrate-binding protein
MDKFGIDRLVSRPSAVGLALCLWSGAAFADSTAPDQSDFVAYAKQQTAKRTELQADWTGPTTGPTIDKGKHIVCIPNNMSNTMVATWCKDLVAIGQKVGWKVDVIDGQGTARAQVTAFNQAIALHPDGIVSSVDAPTVQAETDKAAAAGIVIVGQHFTASPGPDPEHHVFYNIESSPQGIGEAEADYIVAKSDGKARAIVLYDSEYAVARHKAEVMRDEFQKCKTCKLLDYVNLPTSHASDLMGHAMSSWIARFGTPFYVMTIADFYYDFGVPALTQGGVPKTDVVLVGSDGPPSAYDRIRSGLYQTATVPEPVEEQSYQAVDELNRAFHNLPPSGYVPPAFLVTSDNVHTQGGDKGEFNPANDYAQRYLKSWGVTE